MNLHLPRGLLCVVALLASGAVKAHTGVEAGWLHPLSGTDHLLAMIAIGAWSCQMGGRAVWMVPTAFVASMLLGGVLGFEQVDLPGVEIGIVLSVVLLGLAIGLEKTFPVPIAAIGVGLFGMFHGYAHGYEMPVMDDKLGYTFGFLSTTATLHVVGAVGAWGLLKLKYGRGILRLLGFACAACGVYLFTQL